MKTDEKKQLLEELRRDAVIAIVRGVAREKLVPLLEALYDGGVRWAEVTFNQSAPETDAATADAIAGLKTRFAGRMHIGAGTVMTENQAKIAVSAGAEFLISPNTNQSVIRYAVSHNVISIPGAYTPTEIAAAYDAGADAVKVFPADCLGIPYFKAVMASMSHIPLIAVGGVNEHNIADYLRLGIVGVGVGSAITPKDLISNGDFAAITELAKKYMGAMR